MTFYLFLRLYSECFLVGHFQGVTLGLSEKYLDSDLIDLVFSLVILLREEYCLLIALCFSLFSDTF